MFYIILMFIGITLIVYSVVRQKDNFFISGVMVSSMGIVLSLAMIIVGVETTVKVFKAKESMVTYLNHPDMIKTDNVHFIMQVEADYNAALLEAQYKKTHNVPILFTEGLFISKSVMSLSKFDGDIKNQ